MSLNLSTYNCDSCVHCVAGEWCDIRKKWLSGNFIFCTKYEKYVKEKHSYYFPIKYKDKQ